MFKVPLEKDGRKTNTECKREDFQKKKKKTLRKKGPMLARSCQGRLSEEITLKPWADI